MAQEHPSPTPVQVSWLQQEPIAGTVSLDVPGNQQTQVSHCCTVYRVFPLSDLGIFDSGICLQ